MNYQEFIKRATGNGQENQNDGGATVVDRPPVLDQEREERTEPPKPYAVLIHNDDHTPFDVVVEVLKQVFSMNKGRAMSIMMAAHTSGKATVEICPSKDMAETKATRAMDLAATFSNPVTRQPCSLQFSTVEE